MLCYCENDDFDFRPKLQGPLTILPQSSDNYGADSCAILVIPSLPPALIIAESTGKLHHALLLEAETLEEVFSDSCLKCQGLENNANINVDFQL